jgi:hypothetical protein
MFVFSRILLDVMDLQISAESAWVEISSAKVQIG